MKYKKISKNEHHSALILGILSAGTEKHHDSRSQRLKHQLATVNGASLGSV